MYNKIFFLLITLFLTIKSEKWYGEVKGSNRNDPIYGYVGKKGESITGFYLCSPRLYRVHFLGDPEYLWSKYHFFCDPVGIGRPIDGIAISGGKGYQVRLKNGRWLGMVYGYNIKDLNNGMAGILGKEIDGILVTGGNRYNACTGGFSSAPENAAIRVIKKWFGVTVNFDYTDKRTIIDNNRIKVEAEVFDTFKLDYDGKIKLIIENFKIKDFSCGGIEFIKMNELFKKIMDDSFYALKNWETSFSSEIENGQVTVKINYFLRKITFEAATKISKDIASFRGGFRIIIQLKNNGDNIKAAKVAITSFRPYVKKEKKETYSLKLSVFDDITRIPSIIDDVKYTYQPALGAATAFGIIGSALRMIPII